MAFNQLVDAAIVGSINTVLWVLIVARLIQRRRKMPLDAVSSDSITAPRAEEALLFVSFSLALYYLVFATWMIRPPLSGPHLFDPAPWSAVVGVTGAAASLGLVAWAYRVFGSWRLLARVDANHELITDGPFALIRHPIYTGIVGAYVSTLLVVPTIGFLIAVLLIALSHDVRARVEERVLTEAFGSRYSTYLGDTKRFIPGLY
ncbi:isoprenylcysteine carboxylmethyltransferase family protein [Mycobacterium sp. shizuoka-1]|uniref:methyltransferase family protein n=1 Tax=Mycobacterium sp. shizuoka-1 TaxID=2039281 RepID=UPI000C05E1BC|nr:isoprenylcysteine carboxylmethyltransferase family protein [Mycobacterium sp. shizuoka-1]GAY15799.1 farnesyl cysteine carboxyl-methyltransferase [Mycobacterium sp. shizuoka-1]